jgi:Rrf2 family iron-sulfur cluster assembly transcriptional regulator
MLTTKARYAVMAVIDMAYSVNKEQPITLADISLRQNIALSYLEQIFNKLKKAGIVKAIKGPGGGYLLTDYNFEIARIIDAVEENLEMTRCNNRSNNGCMPDNTKCSTHHLWEGLNYQIRDYFNRVTITDIVSGKLKNEVENLHHKVLSAV